jgi:signal recognition particle subunit SRP19
MREQDKIIIWPSYFDSTRTRKDGRRVAKSLAVPAPRISELEEVAKRLHLANELVPEVSYPKSPWLKTGMLLVEKRKSKERTITEIGAQLVKARGATAAKK